MAKLQRMIKLHKRMHMEESRILCPTDHKIGKHIRCNNGHRSIEKRKGKKPIGSPWKEKTYGQKITEEMYLRASHAVRITKHPKKKSWNRYFPRVGMCLGMGRWAGITKKEEPTMALLKYLYNRY